jgi:hypothetical protein
MDPTQRRRPSSAFVVAVVALVVAAGGVAVAEQDPAQLAKPVTAKKAKKIARKVSDKQIDARAPGLSVATAESANPIAFAHISALGGIDQARSKNMGSATVTRPSAGLYCFYGLPFEFKGAQVTTDFDDSMNMYGPQFGSTLSSTCSPPADAYVAMVTTDGTATTNGAFFIVFYN